jgi:hypothetical protein
VRVQDLIYDANLLGIEPAGGRARRRTSAKPITGAGSSSSGAATDGDTDSGGSDENATGDLQDAECSI